MVDPVGYAIQSVLRELPSSDRELASFSEKQPDAFRKTARLL